MADNNRQKVYDILKSKTGYKDSFEDFNKVFDSSEDARKKVYDVLSSKTGYKDSFEEFDSLMGKGGVEAPQYPQEVIDAHNNPDNKPPHYKDISSINTQYRKMQDAVGAVKQDEASQGLNLGYGGMMSTRNGMVPDMRPVSSIKTEEPSRIGNIKPVEEPKPYVAQRDSSPVNVGTNASREEEDKKKQQEATSMQVGDMMGRVDQMISDAKKASDTYAVEAIQNDPMGAARMAMVDGMSFNQLGAAVSPKARAAQTQLHQLETIKRSLQDSQNIIDEANHNAQRGLESTFVAGAVRGMGQKLFDARTWDMGIRDMEEQAELTNALKAYDEGKELTETQQMLLDAKALELATNAYFGSELGRGYKAGQVTAESIPFMLEMVINPASGIGQTVASRLTRYALKRFAGQAAKKMLTKATVAAGRAVSDVAASAAMTATTGSIRTAADAMRRMNGQIKYDADEEGRSIFTGHEKGDDALTAALKAFANTTIENHSEMVGEYFSPLIGAASGFVKKGFGKVAATNIGKNLRLGKVQDFINDVSASDVAKLVSDFEKNAKWSGTVGEFAEEIVGGVENALIVGDQTLDTDEQTGVFDRDNLIDTFLGVSLMGGFMSAAKTVGYKSKGERQYEAYREAIKTPESFKGNDELWEDITHNYISEVPEGMEAYVTPPQDYIASVLDRDDLDWSQKRDFLNYVKARNEIDGVGLYKAKKELDETPIEDIQAQQQEAVQEQPQEQPQADPTMAYRNYLRAERAVGMARTPEERREAENALNAANQVWEPIKANIEQQADEVRVKAEEQARTWIAANQNNEGGIQMAMHGADGNVHITGGNLVMREDGSGIDPIASSDAIYYITESGERKMTKPDMFASVEPARPAEEYYNMMVEESVNQFMTEQEALLGTPEIPTPQDMMSAAQNGDPSAVIAIEGQPYVVGQVYDGNVQLMPVDENMEIDTSKRGMPLTTQQYYDMMEQQMWQPTEAEAQQAAEAQQMQEQPVEAAPSAAEQAPVQEAPAEPQISPEEQAARHRNEVLESLPKDKSGEVDIRKLTPAQQFDYTEVTDGVDVAAQDLLDSIAAAEEKVAKEQEKVSKATGSSRIEARQKLREAQQELQTLQALQNEKGIQAATNTVEEREEPVAVAPEEEAATTEQPAMQEQPKQQEPLIPTDKKGNVLYEQAPIANTIDYLESEELSREELDAFIDNRRKDAEKALKEVEKKQPKMGSDIAKYKQTKAAWQEQQAQAQANVDYWDEVKKQMKNRNTTEVDRLAQERLAHETPETLEELAAMMLGTRSIRISRDSFKKETGYGDTEASKFFPIFEENGMSVSKAGEQVELRAKDFGINFDELDANAGRNAVISALASAQTWGGLFHLIEDNRKAQAEAMKREEERAEAELLDRLANAYNFASGEDYRDYEERYLPQYLREMDVATDEEFYNAIYDEINNLNEIYNGEGTNVGNGEGSPAILPEEQPAVGEREEAVEGQDEGQGSTGEVPTEERPVPETAPAERNEVSIAPSEQLKPTDLRDQVKPDEAGLEKEGKKTFLDVIKELYNKGKEYIKDKYNRSFFDVVDTPDFMKPLGLTGDKFTIGYGVISRHFGKDDQHDLPEEAWERLPEAIKNPFAITRYFSDKEHKKPKGFRLYTSIKVEDGYVVVGVDVKNAGRELEVNSISTVFSRREDAGLTGYEEEIYRDKNITPEQEALLEKPNSSRYQPTQELSTGKDNASSYNLQEKSEKNEPKVVKGEGYTITPTIYTKKNGGTIDMQLVKFDDLTPEQQKTAKGLARQMKGWYDWNEKGFMMRSEEDALSLINAIQAPSQEVQPAEEVKQEPKEEPKQPKEYLSDTYSDFEEDVYDRRLERLRGQYKDELPSDDYLEKKIQYFSEEVEKYKKEVDNANEQEKPFAQGRLATASGSLRAFTTFRREVKRRRDEQKREAVLKEKGLKIGDKVIYKGKEATLTDIDNGRPVLDTGMAPVIYELVEWSDVTLPSKEQISNPSGNKLVTDSRYEELKERMRKKLGGQMNIGIDPEILTIGIEMAVYHIEKGTRKFADYAKAMINDLGDAIRPYLKAFYNGARDLPEVEGAGLNKEMDSADDVRKFDVANFDKPGTDIMATIDEISQEQKVEKQADVAVEKVTGLPNTPNLRPATDADFEDESPIVYYNGKPYNFVMLMRRGEQVSATQFSKPTITGIMLTNGQMVSLSDVMVEDKPAKQEQPQEQTEAKPQPKNEEKPKKQKESKPEPQPMSLDLFAQVEADNENEKNIENIRNNENKPVNLQGSETQKEKKDGLQRTNELRTERPSADNLRYEQGNQESGGRNGEVEGQEGGRADRGRTGSSDEQHRSVRSGLSDSVKQPKNTRNFHIERGQSLAPTSPKARFDANLAAIKKMQDLTEREAEATPADMKVLAKFSGWGGLGAYLNDFATRSQLQGLLGEDGYQQAAMSANSAFYTPAGVIDTLWDVARRLGFKGGNVLEGSAGIGDIIGHIPTDMSQRSDIEAVEIDDVTGNILKLLYPDAKVNIQGFEQTKIPNGSVDLAITNVPFVTGLKVFDDSGDKDLSKRFGNIHDFCIAKNVRKLREGGIGIFITSNGTMDKSDALRTWVTNEGNADFIGAFRLNNKTFGGTSVTSDILIVRKRVNDKRSDKAINVGDVSAERTASYDTGETKRKNGVDVPVIKILPMTYNKYFMDHPENMAGKMDFNFEHGDTYRPESVGLYPDGKDQDKMLNDWLNNLPTENDLENAPEKSEEARQGSNAEAVEGTKEGQLITNSKGEICISRNGIAVPLGVNTNKVKGHTKEECLKSYDKIKKALNNVLDYQVNNEDDKGLEPLLKVLNKAYDDFVKDYGYLNRNTSISFLRNDVDFANIAALESFEEKGDKNGNKKDVVKKASVFGGRVVRKEVEPQPSNINEAVTASIFKNGRLDVPYMAEKLGKSEDAVKEEIIKNGLGFENPITTELEVSFEYLSGNVREKLEQAVEANEDGRYDKNIKALEKVIPMDIPAHLIEFSIGSSWIDPKLYEDYVKDRTGKNVKLAKAGGQWTMSEDYGFSEKNRSFGVRSEMFKKVIPGTDLIDAAMNNKTITVKESHKDPYTRETITEIDKEATQACANKVEEIRQDFKDWARAKMQSDPELSKKISDVYNAKFNNYVPREIPESFVPEHFVGAATIVDGKPFSMREHQGKAAIRATMQPVLLAHEVGTGKTYTMITAAMEMRRLGLAKKPMVVVQNATTGQFAESAKKLYPNAKVLTLDEADRTVEGRKNFYAKIKYNDWDMIIVPQSVFDRIPDSEERQIAYIQDKIAEKMAVLDEIANNDDTGAITRQAQKEIDALEAELSDVSQKLANKKKSKDEKRQAKTRQNAAVKAREMLDREVDDVENFDDMEIDALLIDEAHEYKHLGFATAMQRGVKGIDPSFSHKAQGAYLKIQAVKERKNGKNVVMATGTPISNTAAEVWTFMRYLMPEEQLKEYDIYYFDDFVRNFGNITQMLEFTTNGRFRENNRFAGYSNLPELIRIWSGVADTVLTKEAGEVQKKIPEIETGKAQDIYLPQSRSLRSIMAAVRAELKRYDEMSGKDKKANSHIPLTMYGIAKAAAIDPRLVSDEDVDEPLSKTNRAVEETLRSLKETKDYNGTVAIFCDNYQNKKTGFNLYEEIKRKLVERGVPEEQIVIMKGGMNDKKKADIFAKMNKGDIRVMLGSTFTLGTGVNIQERLHTLIHVDAPNRPMDYTQRNGRILRQGNLHKDWGKPVRVLRFGVEDSLDVTAYQRLKTKGAIADSIMNGKAMMKNNQENRYIEEEEDVFGDTVAQLSGSEYAMLKNQAEKELRKLQSKKQQHSADQIYVHNAIPKYVGQIKSDKKLLETTKDGLKKVEQMFPDGKAKTITVGNSKFGSIDGMADFVKDVVNKRLKETEDKLRSSYGNSKADVNYTVYFDGLKFNIKAALSKESVFRSGVLSHVVHTEMTYDCPEIGFEGVPVSRGSFRNALIDINNNVINGAYLREREEYLQNGIDRKEKELAQVRERDGKPFQFEKELKEAEERVEDLTEKMREELAKKEAKYADIDNNVEAVSISSLTDAEESTEEEASGVSEPTEAYGEEEEDVESMDDNELLDKIEYSSLQNLDLYSEEYDSRHEGEYDDYYEQAENWLEDNKPSAEEANATLSELLVRWRRGGYKSTERTALNAQIIAYDNYLANLKEQEVDAMQPTDFVPGAHPSETKKDTQTYVTKTGKQQTYEQLSLNFTEQKEEEKPKEKKQQTPLDYRLPRLKEGEISYVERKFTEDKTFTLTSGKDKVESADDVAYIFRCLEDKAIEHAFLVFEKNGVPTVIHAGMGSHNQAPVDSASIPVMLDRLKPDRIYMVHNHPSGSLKPSAEDKRLSAALRKMVPSELPMHFIIIDTYKHQYTEFSDAGSYDNGVDIKGTGNNVSYPTYAFDSKSYRDGFAGKQAFSSSGIADYINTIRLGDVSKVGALVMDQNMNIVGNLILNINNADELSDKVVRKLLSNTMMMGGSQLVFYGSGITSSSADKKQMGSIIKGVATLTNGSVRVTDVMAMNKGGDYGYYYSFNDEGVMEPLENYNSVAKDSSVSQRFGSAATSLNQVARAFNKIDWKKGTINLDLGGGRFDKATDFLREKGVENMVFDPFNRSAEHNRETAERVRNEKVDTVTCNNVLNVVESQSSRDNIILQAARALKTNGTAYFSVYEGNKSGVGRQTKSDSWQNNRPTKDYVKEIEKFFDDVTLKDNIITARKPKQVSGESVWDFDGSYSGNDIRFRDESDMDDLLNREVENVIADTSKTPLPTNRKEAIAAVNKMEKPFINKDQNKEIKVSNTGVKHTATQDHNFVDVQCMGLIDEIIRKAVKIGEPIIHEDEIGHTHLAEVYYCPVNIDGVQYSARLLVKQFENRGFVLDDFRLYDLHSREKKTDASSVVRGDKALTPTSAPVSAYKVKDLIHSTQAEDKKLLGLPDNYSTRFRFVGEQGALGEDAANGVRVNERNMYLAQAMDAAGINERIIKLATGWEKGTDGMWKMEVVDGKLRKSAFVDGNLKEGATLSDVWADDRLFKEYPELADIPVNAEELNPNVAGIFDDEGISLNKQMIDDKNWGEVRTTIIHEYQHAIQDIEGFAIGGNANMRVNGEALGQEGYMNLAGEVEARNAEGRTMNSFWKGFPNRITLARDTEDVDRDDQIVIFSNEQSLDDMERTPLSQTDKEVMAKAVAEMGAQLGEKVELVRDVKELPSSEDGARKRIEAGKNVKGWYNPRTKKVYVYLPNTNNVNDAKRTLLHEVVGHKGLRDLLGERGFWDMLDTIWKNLPDGLKKSLTNVAMRKYNGSIYTALDEYLAEQAERDIVPNWWDRVVSAVKDALRKFGISIELTDKDVQYLLWRSRKNLNPTTPAIDLIQDIAMRNRTSDEYKQKPEGETMFRVAPEDIEEQDKDISEAQAYYEQAVNTKSYKFTEAWQDSMLGLKKLQEAIEKGSGEKIADFENAYIAENAMSSRNLAEIEAYKNTFYKDLLDAVKALRNRSTSDADIKTYMIAKHGLERNEFMARREAQKARDIYYNNRVAVIDEALRTGKIDQSKYDMQLDKIEKDADAKYKDEYEKNRKKDYAGLTGLSQVNGNEEAEAEARKIVKEFEDSHEKKLVDDLWAKTKAATTAQLTKLRESGILDKSGFDEIAGMYKYYIPLRGWDEATAMDKYVYLESSKGRMNSPIKQAKGRKSLADDPVATIGNMAESAIVQGNRNLLKQRFLTMALNHPSNLLTVSRVWLRYDDATDKWVEQFPEIPKNATPTEVKEIMEAHEQKMRELSESDPEHYKMARKKDNIPYKIVNPFKNEHQVLVKRNGEDFIITVNGNPRAAQAVNGLTNPDTNKSSWAVMARWIRHNMAANFTSRNPAFVLANFMRDSFFANSMIHAKENNEYAMRFHRNWGIAAMNMVDLVNRYKKGRLDMGNPMDKMFHDFIMNGGETGYTFMGSVEDYKNLIASEMKKANRGRLDPRRFWNLFTETMNTLGRWAEDTSRFAAFMTSLEEGRSMERSIYDAKDISVNFNKKGAGSKAAGEWKKGNYLNWIQASLGAQTGRELYIFWNAGVQSLSMAGRITKQHPVKAAGIYALYMAAGVMVPIAMALIGGAGGDGDDEYYNVSEYTRRTNLMLGYGDNYISLPLPIELRVFYGLGGLFAESIMGKVDYTNGQIAEKAAELASGVLPIDIFGEGWQGFIPSYGKPIAEAYVTKKNFMGIPIYKDSDYMEDMPNWTKAYKSTSPELISLAQTLNEISGGNDYKKGVIDPNPARAEHLLEGYFGGMATTANQFKNGLLMATPWGEELREEPMRNLPIVNRFVKQSNSRAEQKRINEVYFERKKQMDVFIQQLNGFQRDSNNPDKTNEERQHSYEMYLRLKNSKDYLIYDSWHKLDNALQKIRKAHDEEHEYMLKEAMNSLFK